MERVYSAGKKQMAINIEIWAKKRRPSWQRLEQILAIVDKQGVHSLDKESLQELGRLYRAASADLSRARTFKASPALESYLNNLVVKAHNQVYQTAKNRFHEILRFFWITFPELVVKNINYVLVSAALFSLPMIVSYFLSISDSEFAYLELYKDAPLVPDHLWHHIHKHTLWTQSIKELSPFFSSLIATNNIRVAITAFASGITFGIGTVAVLVLNGLFLGTVFGVCKTYGLAGQLFAFVAPHGVLELTAIIISGAAGLLMGKSLLFPGNYRRIDALKLSSRPAFGLFAGCLPLLIVAALIEGFISPRADFSPSNKLMLSAITLLFILVFLFAPRPPQQKK